MSCEYKSCTAHLSPEAQIQNSLTLNLALRLNLYHTTILVGRHDSDAHTKCVCNSLQGHMVAPCAELLHAVAVVLVVFRYVLAIQIWKGSELGNGCRPYVPMLMRCSVKLVRQSSKLQTQPVLFPDLLQLECMPESAIFTQHMTALPRSFVAQNDDEAQPHTMF